MRHSRPTSSNGTGNKSSLRNVEPMIVVSASNTYQNNNSSDLEQMMSSYTDPNGTGAVHVRKQSHSMSLRNNEGGGGGASKKSGEEVSVNNGNLLQHRARNQWTVQHSHPNDKNNNVRVTSLSVDNDSNVHDDQMNADNDGNMQGNQMNIHNVRLYHGNALPQVVLRHHGNIVPAKDVIAAGMTIPEKPKTNTIAAAVYDYTRRQHMKDQVGDSGTEDVDTIRGDPDDEVVVRQYPPMKNVTQGQDMPSSIIHTGRPQNFDHSSRQEINLLPSEKRVIYSSAPGPMSNYPADNYQIVSTINHLGQQQGRHVHIVHNGNGPLKKSSIITAAQRQHPNVQKKIVHQSPNQPINSEVDQKRNYIILENDQFRKTGMSTGNNGYKFIPQDGYIRDGYEVINAPVKSVHQGPRNRQAYINETSNKSAEDSQLDSNNNHSSKKRATPVDRMESERRLLKVAKTSQHFQENGQKCVEVSSKGKEKKIDLNAEQPQVNSAYREVKEWICDICKLAAFSTYEEAAQHERTCNGKVPPTFREVTDWICDKCGGAFTSYDEAARHEINCTGGLEANKNPNNSLPLSLPPKFVSNLNSLSYEKTRLTTEEDKGDGVPKFFIDLYDQYKIFVYCENPLQRVDMNVIRSGYECIYCSSKNEDGRFFPQKAEQFANYFEPFMHTMKCQDCPKSSRKTLIASHFLLLTEMNNFPENVKKIFFKKMFNRIECVTKSISKKRLLVETSNKSKQSESLLDKSEVKSAKENPKMYSNTSNPPLTNNGKVANG